MPEVASELYGELKRHMSVNTMKRARLGAVIVVRTRSAPFCVTIDGQTLQDGTVTIRDRDTLEQVRVSKDDLLVELQQRIGE